MTTRLLRLGICSLGVMLVGVSSSFAQNTNRFTFGIGGGFTNPVKRTDGRLDTGFNILAGAGVNVSKEFGVLAEFGYNQLGVNSTILNSVGAPDGMGRIYSATLNPMVRLNANGRVGFYFTGGGGFYRRTVEFTEPTLIPSTGFDPFYGVFFPTVIPANNVLASFTQNKGGLNIGGGITIAVKGDSNTKFFAEARYHHIYTTPIRTTLLPVTFGLRW